MRERKFEEGNRHIHIVFFATKEANLNLFDGLDFATFMATKTPCL